MGKACVWPEGMPSRREYLEMESREQRRGARGGSDEMDVDGDGDGDGDEDNVMGMESEGEGAKGGGRGEEGTSFMQFRPLPVPYAGLRGDGGEHVTSVHPLAYGSASGVFGLSSGTMGVSAQQVHSDSRYTDSSHSANQYMPQQFQTAQRGTPCFDTNAGNRIAEPYTPARQSLTLDGPFSSDPPPIPDASQDVSQMARSQGSTTMHQTLGTGIFFLTHPSRWPCSASANVFVRTATARPHARTGWNQPRRRPRGECATTCWGCTWWIERLDCSCGRSG